MNYLNILDCSIADGEGIRIALYVSGCSLHCPHCHNPQSWDKEAGKPFTEETKEKLFELLNREYIDGITFTGGHPLECYNLPTVTALCKEIKEKFPNKNIWLYTGFVYETVKNLEIMKYIDVLVDGPYIEAERDITLPYRGSKNQRIIYLKNGERYEHIQTND